MGWAMVKIAGGHTTILFGDKQLWLEGKGVHHNMQPPTLKQLCLPPPHQNGRGGGGEVGGSESREWIQVRGVPPPPHLNGVVQHPRQRSRHHLRPLPPSSPLPPPSPSAPSYSSPSPLTSMEWCSTPVSVAATTCAPFSTSATAAFCRLYSSLLS